MDFFTMNLTTGFPFKSIVKKSLFYIIVIRKGSFGFGTFGLGKKWHQHTVKRILYHSITKEGPRQMGLGKKLLVKSVTYKLTYCI